MAFPVILIDSATGSDSAASGAGPSTALTGTAATTDGAGTLVTLDGSPDLTGVATDGSHVIWLDHNNARTFGKITAKDNGAKTVTVADAFDAGLSGKSWAIGGRRASFGNAATRRLIEAGGFVVGDLLPGWAVEFASGHTEAVSGPSLFRVFGNYTDGPITFRGADGGTRPVLEFPDDAYGFSFGSSSTGVIFKFLEMRSTGTKTAVPAVQCGNIEGGVFDDVWVTDDGSNPWAVGFGTIFRTVTFNRCVASGCAGDGFQLYDDTGGGFKFLHCFAVNNGGHGFNLGKAAQTFGGVFIGCISGNNAGDGFLWGDARVDGLSWSLTFVSNTAYGNGGNGLTIVTDLAGPGAALPLIVNNIFANNGGYGVEFEGAGVAAEVHLAVISNNDFFSNTSGKYLPAIANSFEEQTLDPQFVNAAANDFRIGDNLKALGAPTSPFGDSATQSYVDIGAVQAICAAAIAAVALPFRTLVNAVRFWN